MTQPTPIPGEAIEAAALPEAVWNACAAAYHEANTALGVGEHVTPGVPGLHAALKVAYAAGVEAGRERAMAGMREEWGVDWDGPYTEHGWTETYARVFAYPREGYTQLAVLRRHVTEWAEAEQGGQG